MTVYLRNNQKKHKVDSRTLKKQINTLLKYLDCQDSEVSILLVNDAKIRKLNLQYRKIDKPTDVLSFPQEDDSPSELNFQLLGDVVVSAETAQRQAREHRLFFNEELVLLTYRLPVPMRCSFISEFP